MQHFIKRSLFSSIIVSAICATSATHASANLRNITGKVYDANSSELVYIEQHKYQERDGKQLMLSTYTNPDNQMIGKRVIEYQGDRVSNYVLEQAGLNFKESATRFADQITLSKTKDDKQTVKQIDSILQNDVVIDAGFNDFVVRNWDALNNGETLKFNFASPGQMNILKLQVKKVGQGNNVLSQHGINDNVSLYEMTIANPILRMLIKPIEVGYFSKTKQLAYYRGISNIKNQDGKNYTVRIHFDKNLG